MGWRRCPRCGSGAVVEKSSDGIGCSGCLLLFMYIFTGMAILGGIVSGGFIERPLSTLVSILILIGIIMLIKAIKRKFSEGPKSNLYCKSCELHFKN
ncbi:hypothetical protein ACWEZE_01180 [Staphylococcus shinii]|uniref:hypothetical protein n=1 Tax=Staphylococcus shinii TaxID=2912228 RepID=UPI000C330EE0|nr:hypothetical protein [Staphylococcus shinii]PKI09759.1 hypothetical protein CW747_05375 [Staphylococcus shinii]